MDNISRDNNTSYLPIAGLIVGLIGLALGAIALGKVSSTNKAVTEQGTKVATIEETQTQARDAAAKVNTRVDGLIGSINTEFGKMSNTIGTLLGDVAALKEMATKPKAPVGTTGAVSTVAGPNEYVVKAGDIGGKIAAATGFTVAQIEAVNPGLDWTKLKIGQKLKLPLKK